MAKMELICFGELKFKGLKELEAAYLEKINRLAKFSITRLKDVAIRDEEARKKKEGRAMLDQLQAGDFVVALDEAGRTMTSIKFARFLEEKISFHPGRLVFLIGGHAGLAAELAGRIDFKLSFSPMTFAHDIFRLLFLEQVFRGLTINKGITYHR